MFLTQYEIKLPLYTVVATAEYTRDIDTRYNQVVLEFGRQYDDRYDTRVVVKKKVYKPIMEDFVQGVYRIIHNNSTLMFVDNNPKEVAYNKIHYLLLELHDYLYNQYIHIRLRWD